MKFHPVAIATIAVIGTAAALVINGASAAPSTTQQLIINQRISQTAVIRSNQSLNYLAPIRTTTTDAANTGKAGVTRLSNVVGSGLGWTTAQIANGAVTTAKIANGAVTTAKIANGAVTSAQIASGAVTTAKIASGAVTSAQIASGAVTTAKIASGVVTSAQIANGAVTNAKLANPIYVAQTTATGAISPLTPGVTAVLASVGVNTLTFPVSVAACTFATTIGGATPGFVTVSPVVGTAAAVTVETFSAAAPPVPLTLPVHIIAYC